MNNNNINALLIWLDEINMLYDVSTPGEWFVKDGKIVTNSGYEIAGSVGLVEDAEFIVSARSNVHTLMDTIRTQHEKICQIQKSLKDQNIVNEIILMAENLLEDTNELHKDLKKFINKTSVLSGVNKTAYTAGSERPKITRKPRVAKSVSSHRVPPKGGD